MIPGACRKEGQCLPVYLLSFRYDCASLPLLLKAPEGYAPDSTEYHAPESYGDVTITLKAA